MSTITTDISILQKKSTNIPPVEELIKIKEELESTIVDDRMAMGLSAIQIGIEVPMFVIKKETGEFLNFIDPKIEILGPTNVTVFTEGCLSFPGINVDTIRYKNIKVTFKKINHENKLVDDCKTFNGILAAAVQHETDHTMGILFLQRAIPIQRSIKDYKQEDYVRCVLIDGTPDFILPDAEETLLNKKPLDEIKSLQKLKIGYRV